MDEKIKLVTDYSADDFEILEGLEPIRRDPNMYINSTGVDGILHMLVECLDNSVDESKELKGIHKVIVKVDLLPDGTAIVEDNARGIPVDLHSKHKKPAVYIAFEHIHGGSKIRGNNGRGYQGSGGTIGVHGVGMAVVNGLSDKLKVRIKREGKIYEVEYAKGKRIKDLTVVGECSPEETGTRIEFKYDGTIMKLVDTYHGSVDYPFDIESLREVVENYVIFNDNVEFIVNYDKGNGDSGHLEFNKEELNIDNILSNACSSSLTRITESSEDDPKFRIDIRFGISENLEKVVRKSAVNGLYVKDGGSHINAFEDALCDFVKSIFESRGWLREEYSLLNSEILRHVSYIIQLTVENPTFEGQVKKYFQDPMLGYYLRKFLETLFSNSNPETIDSLLTVVREIYNDRVSRDIEKKKQKELKLKKVDKKEALVLQEYFVDCISNSKNKTQCWFVEGTSAGISFAKFRDEKYLAYCELRGKLLNVAKRNPEKIKRNTQFKMFQSIVQKNKFGKYIICTDADIDGKHIRNLFCVLIRDWFPEIIDKGMLYIAMAPLYRLRYKGEVKYAYSDAEKDSFVEKGAIVEQRFKGLGEMDAEELYECVVKSPKLVQVTMDSTLELSGTEGEEDIVDLLMSDSVDFRRNLILDLFGGEKLKKYFSKKSRIKKGQSLKVDPMVVNSDLGLDLDFDDEDDYELEVDYSVLDKLVL